MSSNSFDYTYLNWDSDFFGVSSGRIVLKEEISSSNQKLIQEKLLENQFTVIYNENNLAANNIWLGEETSASLTDINVQFLKTSKEFSQESVEHVIISNALPTTDDILEIASQSFNYSRFFNDPYLNKDKASLVYWNWVKSSFGKEEKYFAQFIHDSECHGFILFSKQEKTIIIELIAVKKSTLQKGIGTKLLQNLEAYASKSGVERIKVGTQINNVGAIRFYTNNGYIFQSATSVYHHWIKRS